MKLCKGSKTFIRADVWYELTRFAIRLFSAARHVIDDPLLRSLTFSDWEAALVYFAQKAEEERLVLVLDEFQYLCEDNAALPSLIQRFWDLHGKNSQLFLILCGSQVRKMEREVLAEKSPLYGRRTGQLQLMPLSYRDSGRFFPEYSPKEKIVAYGIGGGIPAYLNRFDPQKTLEQNIKDELLSVQSYLFDEVNFPRNFGLLPNGSGRIGNPVLTSTC